MNKGLLLNIIKKVPEGFEDVSQKQFIKLTDIIFSNKHELRKKMESLVVFLGWQLILFNDYQRLELSHLVDWLLFEDNKCEKTIVKSIRIRMKKYDGPIHKLHNITWGSFRNVSDYFELYEKNKDESFLDKGIALLYPDDDYDKQVERVSMLYPGTKMAIYWNWVLMITALADIFPYLFKKSAKNKEKSKRLHLWYNFMNEWLEFKVEEFEKKDKIPAMEILSGLNLQMKHSKEEKNKTKK
jgi:hypothetical protein